MNNSTYHRLQEIFSRFNESVITFYNDLANLLPEGKQKIISSELGNTLEISNNLFKQVAEILYKH
jgi:hypothetical protein